MADRNRFAAFMASVKMAGLGTAKTVEAATGEETVLTAEQFETTVSAAIEDGETAGFSAGVKAERERFAAVLGTDQAKANLDGALHMLATTDNTAEQINGTLAKFPAPVAPAAPTGATKADGTPMTAAERIAAETGKTDVKPNGEVKDGDDRKAQVSSSVERFNARQPGFKSTVGAAR